MSADLQLFVEQVSWLAKSYLPDATRRSVIAWIGARLSPDVRARWLTAFPIHHPTQWRAEKAFIEVMKENLSHQRNMHRIVELPTRGVDWAATYTRSDSGFTRPPMPYVVRVARAVPDRALVGALVSMGRGWLTALEWAIEGDARVAAPLRARAADLRSALLVAESIGGEPAALDGRLIERLRRLGASGTKLADLVHEIDRLWGGAFTGAQDDVQAIRTLGASLEEANVGNADTLLELSSVLSVARAATDGESTWTLAKVQIGRAGKYPPLILQCGDLQCHIDKGTPVVPGAGKVQDLVSPWLDEVVWGGDKRARSRQPDIVLRFSHRKHKRVLFALADAKRNVTGEGASYLRSSVDVAAVYLMAFGHALGLHVGGSSNELRTTLVPGMTLFCQQGAKRDPVEVIKLLSGGTEAIPTVMAFDVAKHFGPGPAGWQSPTLAAWFASLGRQAAAEFERAVA
ncbi:MAG: uncharacterized protein JWP97_4064 [Labilithrix sp.]|nr:uncharacterized protein [Labilithrix sp.]